MLSRHIAYMRKRREIDEISYIYDYTYLNGQNVYYYFFLCGESTADLTGCCIVNRILLCCIANITNVPLIVQKNKDQTSGLWVDVEKTF